MSALSKVLREAEGDMLLFWCPGCGGAHGVRVGEGPGARWSYNGNADAPTFSPSILVRHEHWVPPATSENMDPGPQEKVVGICHSFVRDGQIQFLSDCTHELAGQTVPLPNFDGGKP